METGPPVSMAGRFQASLLICQPHSSNESLTGIFSVWNQYRGGTSLEYQAVLLRQSVTR